jgi:L-cysteine/cystine lyase
LNHATTDGMNIATWAVDWKPGDAAITTTHEHLGALGPLYALRDRLEVRLGFVEIADDADDDTIVDSFAAHLERGARLVSVSHVLWTTGRVMPIARIAQVVHAHRAWLVVDGAQSAGAIPLEVGTSGADLYAIPAQKWLLGPEGMGALWCSPGILGEARPAFAGYYSYASGDSSGNAVPHDSARRLESSSWHRPSVVGFARSVGWLSMYIGLDFVYRRGAAMARLARAGLASIPGVTVLTPADAMAGLISFRIAGWPCQAALDELGARVFAIARVVPLIDALRISVGFFNREDELERFVAAVALLAEHTPDTIPPRRTLTILGEG